ncbi:MAG: sensor histidine kinase [Beijerinckiaceae bacterium]
MAEGVDTGERRRKGFGLSTRLLVLTVLFVMLAEVLIFVPSIANFRDNWLNDRLSSAGTAALVLQAAPDDAIPEELVKQLLDNVGAETIALRIRGTRRLLAISETPDAVERIFDLRSRSFFRSIRESFGTLVFGGKGSVGVIGNPPAGGDFVEIVIREKPLREAMWGFALNILALSLFISAITAMLVYFTLRRLIVAPVERLTGSIMRFAEKPEDATRLLKPSGRTDEIGNAESAVAGMQQQVAQQLKQKQHLAALGLAVSKINHDLRNMLSSAQLISDRLGVVKDPTVQRFAPKLLQTLDRAIAFCQSTLAYGKAEERAPDLRPLNLRQAMEEAKEIILVDEHASVGWANGVPADIAVMADSEHLYRIAGNIFRNAVQAMEAHPAPAGGHWLSVTARRDGQEVEIEIADTGPGVPDAMAKTMFSAFHGSTRQGGSGLGLAIAAELIRAQGGEISLGKASVGACFRLRLKAA